MKSPGLCKPRRLLLGLLSAGFLLGLVAWVLYVPYRPARLFRAMPIDVRWVTGHEQVATRWPVLLSNPLLWGMAETFGAGIDADEDWLENETFQRWVKRLADRQVVLGYTPRAGLVGEPAWIVASWLGGRSRVYRWVLGRKGRGMIQRAGQYAGRAVWVIDPANDSVRQRFYFALVDGALIGCWSADPSVIRSVLECCDGMQPSWRPPWDETPRADAWDYGWIVLADDVLSYGLPCLTESQVGGWIDLPVNLVWNGKGVASEDVVAWDAVVGRAAQGGCLLPGHVALDLLNRFPPDWRVADWLPLWKAAKPRSVGLAVLGGDYSGRFRSIKIPGLLLGANLDQGEPFAVARQMLDRLNARWRWGLIPRLILVDETPVYTVEGTAQNVYSELLMSEQVAFTRQQSWLLMASNMKSLAQLLRTPRQRAGVELAWPSWMQNQTGPLAGYGWFDLAQGGKTLRIAVTAYGLKLKVRDARNTYARRRRLNEIKAWIDALGPLEMSRFWLLPGADSRAHAQLVFELGRQAQTENDDAKRSTEQF